MLSYVPSPGSKGQRAVRAFRLAFCLGVAAAACAGLAACGFVDPASSSSRSSGDVPGIVAASSKDVSFVVDRTTTYGTLEIPAHRSGQRLAAALLLAGSGPTDRDGNQPGITPDTLQFIAGTLAQKGIMSLRFDKYFSGKTGAGAFASGPGSIDVGAFLRQADAAYDFLRSQPEASTGRMLVVGHSEGGVYALLVAESVTPRPAGLALIEPQDERFLSLLELQLDDQLNATVAQGKMTATAARQSGREIQQVIARFRAGRRVTRAGLAPFVVQGLAAELFTPANLAYTRTADAIRPLAIAARLRGDPRVLVTDGTADTNVPPSTIGPLVRALHGVGTTGPGLVTLPGVDHFLFQSPATTSSALASAVVSALMNWAQPYATAPPTSH